MKVTDDEAIAEHVWFAARPHREYRARISGKRIWLMRRFGEVFLRTEAAGPLPADTDAAIQPLWSTTVYPDFLTTDTRRRARKKAAR